MFAEVVFPLPFRFSFTYSIPEELEEDARAGVRAVAPFGKRVLTGFIINVKETADIEGDIKPLSDVLDKEPVFTDEQFRFYNWLSGYYLSSLGEALKLGVPYGIEVESKKRIIADTVYCGSLLNREKKNSIKAKLLKELCQREEMSYAYLQKIVKKKNIYSALKSLEKDGAVTILDEVERAKVRAKKAFFVKLIKPVSEVYNLIPSIESRSPKQVIVLLEIIQKKEIALADLLKKSKASRSSVDSLAEKGIVQVYEKEIERRYSEQYKEEKTSFALTARQKEIVDVVSGDMKAGRFKTYLLYGITGSGKTQVYIELIKEAVAAGKTAIILVPEISLTPQITTRITNAFEGDAAVLHSRMSIGERYDTWRRVLRGDVKIVIGARSALFAPLKNIGLIVVDEEHDQSYKQSDTAPKYNARDCAVILGREWNCPVILGSATPSVESMYNAKTGKYKLLEMPERIDHARLPKIELINISRERKMKKMENIFSKFLLNKIEDRLKKKEGIIILQNRRGFSTQVYCEDCGEVETCVNCSVPMVYHINNNTLQCHYCGLIKPVPDACTNCGSLHIKYFGTGTERVEDELQIYFPDARIRRIDSDSINKKSSLSKILSSFAAGEIDILVGTQMVSKGLDFARVTLVGVISAEISLWLPDFRADERTFQLLTQVSGRAGRDKIEGEVVIQTFDDRHFALQKVLHNDYAGFYEKEISQRQAMGYPPFTRLCLIEFKDAVENKAQAAAEEFYETILPYRKYIQILDPVPALIARIKGLYRFHILIKSPRETDASGSILRKAVTLSYIEYNKKTKFKDVRLLIDIDPQMII